MTIDKKKVVIIGGGTFSHVRSHLALAAPAFGNTAREIADIIRSMPEYDALDVDLRLTKMADHESVLVTNADVEALVDELINDASVKIIIFNAAMCDYDGQIRDVESGKHATRLWTAEGEAQLILTPAQKVIGKIRKIRKDIFLVGFKTTADARPDGQFHAGLNLLKAASCNIVLANDVVTRRNMLITPEEGCYEGDRAALLRDVCRMAYLRSHLTFTRSTVLDGTPVPWADDLVYPALRDVVNWCVARGAYKRFRGATTGHFAAKLSDTEFLTSIRKTDFNDIDKNGMVRVRTSGPDTVLSMGAKPSVGGQSQRIIFGRFADTDCIVHFHCPLREDARDEITVMSQYEYECGSHQCGENTANGLSKHGNVYAVMLDRHGPNIVFHHDTPAQEVIDFIAANFDLTKSTSGYEKAYLQLTSPNQHVEDPAIGAKPK